MYPDILIKRLGMNSALWRLYGPSLRISWAALRGRTGMGNKRGMRGMIITVKARGRMKLLFNRDGAFLYFVMFH